MGRALMQKVIEAGIVPSHAVKQLKAWKQLSVDVPEEEQQQLTQQRLMEFVQDIGALLEEDGEMPELRETVPGLDVRFDAESRDCMVVFGVARQTMSLSLRALADKSVAGVPSCVVFEAGRYGEAAARTGSQVSLGDGKIYEVVEATPLYRGEDVAFYRCGVQEVPEHAQVSELRQLGQ